MRRSLSYFCCFLFVLLTIRVSASDYILRRRFKRELNSRNQNLSQHNFDPAWYNPKQPTSSRNGSQWNNPRDSYSHGYSLNPNNLTLIETRPQNIYGPNNYPNTYNVQPPAWNGPNQQRNNPNDQFYPGNYPRDRQWINPNDQFYKGNIPRDRQWNNPNDQYYQRNNPQDIGWKPENTSGYNTGQNGYNSRSSVFNGTRSQLINPAPQRNNPGGNNYQGNLNYPYNPTQTSTKPQNTSWYNTNPYGQNTKPSYGQEWNDLGNQYFPVPNDLSRDRYKRSINNRYYNASSYHRDPYLHSSNKPLWNSTNPYGNWTQYNNRSRWTRDIRDSRQSHNLSWYNTDPSWYKYKPLSHNSSDPEWNKPDGHYYQWPVNNQNNETYYNMVSKHEDFPRHHHSHRHHHHISGPPQFGPPPPVGPLPPIGVGPPPHYWPKHHSWPWRFNPPPLPNFHPRSCIPGFNSTSAGNGTTVNGTYPWVPENGIGSNDTVINGTNPWVPETGSGLNGTNVNSTYPWGPELPDLDERNESVGTPDPA